MAKKKKKKSRFGYYLYAVTVLFLTIAIIAVSAFLLTYVQKIDVTGTQFCSEEEVIEVIKEDPYTVNSLYAFWKYKTGGYVFPACVENVTIGFKAPWALKVTVEEKEIVGCILSGQEYVYFSEDQTVIFKGSEMLDNIPVVEGLEVGAINEMEKLQIENEKVFSYIMNISDEIQKNKLYPDRIVWEEDSMNLYFAGIRVQLGKTNFDEKLVQLPPILANLEGQIGILHLEHYSDVSSGISFEKEEKNY